MNNKKKIFSIGIALALIVAAHFAFDTHSADATTCLGAGSGGTGICNATSSNVGQAIVVSSTVTSGGITVPIYTYKTISGGGGGGTATTTINGTQSATFNINGTGAISSTLSGVTTTFFLINTGNWSGTWQGVNSSTFYWRAIRKASPAPRSFSLRAITALRRPCPATRRMYRSTSAPDVPATSSWQRYLPLAR